MSSCYDIYTYDQEYRHSFEYYQSQLKREYDDSYEYDEYECSAEQEEPVHTTMEDVFQELLSRRFKLYYETDLKQIDQKIAYRNSW